MLAGKEAAHLPNWMKSKTGVRADIVKKSRRAGQAEGDRARRGAANSAGLRQSRQGRGVRNSATELVARDSVYYARISPAADKWRSPPVGGVSSRSPPRAYGVIKVLERQELKTDEFNSAKPTFSDES